MPDQNEKALIADILGTPRTIALVGASDKPERDSFQVMNFMMDKGHRVIPVNPMKAGGSILGQKVFKSLKDIPGSFDMVEIFRQSSALPGIFDEVRPLIQTKGIKIFWCQLGVGDRQVAKDAEESGLHVIMDRCPVIEYKKLK